MGQLTSNYPRRAAAEVDADALLAAWWRVLEGKPWITAAIFDQGVQLTLSDPREFLPAVGEFVAICEYAKRCQETAAEREERAALPAPAHELSIAEGGAPSAGYLAFRESFRERFGRYPDGAGIAERQATEAREATRRTMVRDQAVREYQKTPKGRAFLKEFTYDDLVQAELRQFQDRGGVPPTGRSETDSASGQEAMDGARVDVAGNGDGGRGAGGDPGVLRLRDVAGGPEGPRVADDLAHVPDGDGPAAADWLAELGTTQTR